MLWIVVVSMIDDTDDLGFHLFWTKYIIELDVTHIFHGITIRKEHERTKIKNTRDDTIFFDTDSLDLDAIQRSLLSQKESCLFNCDDFSGSHDSKIHIVIDSFAIENSVRHEEKTHTKDDPCCQTNSTANIGSSTPKIVYKKHRSKCDDESSDERQYNFENKINATSTDIDDFFF